MVEVVDDVDVLDVVVDPPGRVVVVVMPERGMVVSGAVVDGPLGMVDAVVVGALVVGDGTEVVEVVEVVVGLGVLGVFGIVGLGVVGVG